MIIYKTTNLKNNKIYIGQDTKNDSNYFGSGFLIKKAIKKYGKKAFKKEILEYCKNQNHLNEREIYWIKRFNSKDQNIGYNITDGGKGISGYSHTDETKKIISEKCIGKNMGDLNSSRRPENRKKASKRMKGNKINLGRKFPKEHREKISKSLKGENNGMYGKTPHNKINISYESIYDAYIIKDYNVRDIADILLCSVQPIWRVIRENKLVEIKKCQT